MKAFTITGPTGSGKTSVIEKLIAEFAARGFSVGSVKEIHFEAFAIDTEGKNTWRHRRAGAGTVTARSRNETDVMYPGRLPIYEVLSRYDEDIVALEGVRDALVPQIVCCKEDGVPEITPLTIAVSGRFAIGRSGGTFKGLPVIDGLTDCKRLADLLEDKMPTLMPDVPAECCSECGADCRAFLAACLRGDDDYSRCPLRQSSVTLKIDGRRIEMVPFVERLLKNEVLGVVSELKGFKKGSRISVELTDCERSDS